MSDFFTEDGDGYDPSILTAAQVAQQVAQHVATEQNTAAAQIAHQQWLMEQESKHREKADAILARATKEVPGLANPEWAPKIQSVASGFLPASMNDEEAIIAAYKKAAGILQAEANAAEQARNEAAERDAWAEVVNVGNGSYAALMARNS